MAYRYEKTENGKVDLVIDGWENGIASSPFKGIANIKNLNIKYYDGVAYVNYKRQACTITGATLGRPQYACQSPAGVIYITDDTAGGGNIFQQTAANGTTFAAITGASSSSPIIGIAFWNNYLFVFRTSGTIEICGDGNGDSGVTSGNWNTGDATTGVWPIDASASVTLTGNPVAGSVSATISSYTDAQGESRAFWNGPTGYYRCSFSGVTGQQVIAYLIQGSAAVAWSPGLNSNASGAVMTVRPRSSVTIPSTRMTLIAANDGDLYFCNGDGVGAFKLNSNQTFSKGNMLTFNFYAQILALPPTEMAVWLSELKNQLFVAGRKSLYPWDFFSPYWDTPIPMDEQISKMINILNNIYIFAGNKGNIYVSNGYSVSRFTKIPDYIATGAIDPAWLIGGIMQHRQKLYFQALGQNAQSNSKVVQGVFSLDLDTGAINMENENSSAVGSGSDYPGILVDISDSSLLYDKYYSAGDATANFVDYNDTTLYSNNEPLIESDLIPVGTFLQNKSFSSAEFKLDQPMQSSDSISLYARQSLSDSYTLLGTTSTAVLSDCFQNFPIEKFQWAQFKVTLSCTANSTSSSFNRLREIRIR